MASVEPDEMLVELAEQIDLQLMDWMVENKLPPLNVIAVVLARMARFSKETDCVENFIALLEAPKEILNEEIDKEKVVH
jgi:hypothetical protein